VGRRTGVLILPQETRSPRQPVYPPAQMSTQSNPPSWSKKSLLILCSHCCGCLHGIHLFIEIIVCDLFILHALSDVTNQSILSISSHKVRRVGGVSMNPGITSESTASVRTRICIAVEVQFPPSPVAQWRQHW